MKRLVVFFVLVAIMLSSITYINKNRQASQLSISEKLIRFHVIANSDTTSDQVLKLKVRDEVLMYLTPKLKNSKSIEESRQLLLENTEYIESISRKVIRENGYDYDIKLSLSRENFPVKTYGNITLPEGEYEACRILIGSGEGHNWWCVMFPPLCFTDISKGQVAYKETEKEMKSILTNDEYDMVNNLKDTNEVETSKINGKKVILRFKFDDIFRNLKGKITEVFKDKNE